MRAHLTFVLAFSLLIPSPACAECLTSADCGDDEWCSSGTCEPRGGDADPCPESMAWGSSEPCYAPNYLCAVAMGGHDYDGQSVCQPTCDVCAQTGECTGATMVQPLCEACGCPE